MQLHNKVVFSWSLTKRHVIIVLMVAKAIENIAGEGVFQSVLRNRWSVRSLLHFSVHMVQQECIPVGCVPAARRPYAGVCYRGGGEGGLLPGWGCLLPGEALLWGGSAPRGVSAPGGRGGGGGVCSRGGIPACTEAEPPMWTEWQTGVKILPWIQLRCGR